jgi:hypothetical protein
VALAVHLGHRVLASLELNGREYFDRVLTPFWVDNQHILELTPGLRLEITPRLVLEAGVGIGLTPATRDIYAVRAVAGLTYEFSLY